MKVSFYDRTLKTELKFDCVLSLHKRKVNYNGRIQSCWVCVRAYWSDTLPCNRFDLFSCSL